MKSCFMFGHADTPYSILPQIEAAVEMQYSQYGIRHFYVGSRGSFDALAATAVKRAKTRHPDIYLYLILAYHPADRPVTLTDGFDGSYYPPLESVPRSYSIVRANRHMTQNTDSIICYVKHVGNSRNLLEYAQKQQAKRKLIIENLAGND